MVCYVKRIKKGGGTARGDLAKLPNIGPVVEQQLVGAGITTPQQLREAGSKEAWLKIRAVDESACIHRLLALEGAVQGIKKSELSPEKKAELREFCRLARQK